MSSKPVTLFIDCEWNDYKGELISMALVSVSGHEFYKVVSHPEPSAWVKEHVIPILNAHPVPRFEFQRSLAQFLRQFPAVHIIADWPEDIAYFCNALITGPGRRLDTPELTFEVARLASHSELPHNALADAKGLMHAYFHGEPMTMQLSIADD